MHIVTSAFWGLCKTVIHRFESGCRLHLFTSELAARLIDKSAKVTLNRWPDSNLAKAQERDFEKIREDLVGPCLESWRAYCHYFLMELVVPPVNYFRQVRGKSSLLNFQDLLLLSSIEAG